MNLRLGNFCLAIAACLAAFGAAKASVDALPIKWSELRPADQQPAPATPGAAASIAAKGETLSWNLQGKRIELRGYVLPVDREGDLVYEFLLLPLTGICSHVRPPPPNQIIHVIPERPYRLNGIYEPVSISGTLKPELETTQLFILDGVTAIESGYSVGRAQVAPTESVPDAVQQPAVTPWSFLRKK